MTRTRRIAAMLTGLAAAALTLIAAALAQGVRKVRLPPKGTSR
jgi:hypothetical protein